MKRTFFVLALLLGVFAVAALAADVGGVWKAQMPTRDGGTRDVTFNFKQDGDKLTGTTTGFQGEDIQISNGKVSGDTVSFVVVREFQGNQVKMLYTGQVAGNEIKFKMKREGGEGREREFVAKKVS